MHLPALFSLLTTTLATHTLYATHYSGQVYTLHLDVPRHANANSTDKAQLSIASAATTCGSMPSWLTVDHDAGVLYCTDENEEGGSLTVLAGAGAGAGAASGDGGGDSGGKLKEIAKTPDVGGGVNSVVYGRKGKGGYLAVAH